jgi:poly(A) polymerase
MLVDNEQKAMSKKQTDLDFVVLGSGLAFATAVSESVSESGGTLVPFPDFDTARFVFTEEHEGVKTALAEIEFAGARSERYDVASRKPIVAPATLETVLSRRDFTVNAMARQVMKGGKLGSIIDPYNGTRDIHERILRTPLDPDMTFFDDPLRMMRAARFASQLNFSIDPAVLESMVRNASRLKIISVERIKEELWKLLATSRPSVGLTILYGTKLQPVHHI